MNDRIGHLAGDAVLAEAAERVRDVVRTADVACRVGGDEFAVILPESSLEDAEQLYSRHPAGDLDARRSARPGACTSPPASPSCSPEDDSISLFERADDALYRGEGGRQGPQAVCRLAEVLCTSSLGDLLLQSDPSDAPWPRVECGSSARAHNDMSGRR